MKNNDCIENLKCFGIAMLAIPTAPILALNTFLPLSRDEKKQYLKELKECAIEIKNYIIEEKTLSKKAR